MSDGAPESGPTEDDGDDGSYSGILGAVPYAFRSSESRLFRSYAVLGGLLTGLVVLLFALAIVVLLGQTAAAPGGTFTFSRAFFLVLMLLVVGPLLAPVLSVARRHRKTGSTVAYDRAMAASGYLFLASLYVLLVITVPAEQQQSPTGLLGPVVALLYDLPQVAGVVPPLLAVGLLFLVHRRFR